MFILFCVDLLESVGTCADMKRLALWSKPVCYKIFTFGCVLSNEFFEHTEYRGVQWRDEIKCVPISSPKSILLALCLCLVSVSFSLFRSSWCYLLQNGLWGQKHQHGCFPLWRTFSSSVWFIVWLVELLHYTGHLYWCKFPAEAYWSLLVS